MCELRWLCGAILDVTAGGPHVFQAFAGELDKAGDAPDRAAAFLVERLAEPA